MALDAAVRRKVRKRAHDRCEYCHLRQEHSALNHHFEHIVPRKHGGVDTPENLALACHRCNLSKGPNLTGIDPETGKLCQLFHPRRNRWSAHFRFQGLHLMGISPIGRTTVQTLSMNDSRRLELRAELLQLGELD